MINRWLSQNSDAAIQPEGCTMAEHRRNLLESMCEPAFDKISAVGCAAYDRSLFEFITVAINLKDL